MNFANSDLSSGIQSCEKSQSVNKNKRLSIKRINELAYKHINQMFFDSPQSLYLIRAVFLAKRYTIVTPDALTNCILHCSCKCLFGKRIC